MFVKQAGTLAASSCITAVIVWVRWLFEYVYKRVKRNPQGQDAKYTKAMACLVRCALRCLERFIRYTNRNAQILASITGHGYCKSVGLAFKFETSNVREILVINTVGDAILFLSKVFITVVCTLICFGLCKATKNKDMIIMPVVLTVAISYFVAFYVMEILELTIDVIFMSYVYETEMMLGERANGMASFAPGGLSRLLQEHDESVGLQTLPKMAQ